MKFETLSLDFDTSAKLADLIVALPQRCWLNAINALPYLPGGWYVEGWLIIDGLPIEYGWCEWEGKVVDPTLYHRLNRLGTRYFFLPGVKYSPDDVINLVQKKGVTLPFVGQDGHGGFSNKAYLDAFNQLLCICDEWDE